MDIGTITVCRKYYRTEEEYHNAVGRALFVLFENYYHCIVREEESIVIIEYDYEDTEISSYRPVWLTWQEEEQILFQRREDENLTDENGLGDEEN